jgi:hypothetical protein
VFQGRVIVPAGAEEGLRIQIAGRGLHSFTLELDLSNSRTHS